MPSFSNCPQPLPSHLKGLSLLAQCALWVSFPLFLQLFLSCPHTSVLWFLEDTVLLSFHCNPAGQLWRGHFKYPKRIQHRGRALAQQWRSYLGCPHLLSVCLGSSPTSAPACSFLLVCTPGGNMGLHKHLGPCYPLGDPDWVTSTCLWPVHLYLCVCECVCARARMRTQSHVFSNEKNKTLKNFRLLFQLSKGWFRVNLRIIYSD